MSGEFLHDELVQEVVVCGKGVHDGRELAHDEERRVMGQSEGGGEVKAQGELLALDEGEYCEGTEVMDALRDDAEPSHVEANGLRRAAAATDDERSLARGEE